MLIGEFQAPCWITHHCGDVFKQAELSGSTDRVYGGVLGLITSPPAPMWSLVFRYQLSSLAAWVVKFYHLLRGMLSKDLIISVPQFPDL